MSRPHDRPENVPTDAGDGAPETTPPDNARAGAGGYGTARTGDPEITTGKTVVRSESGEAKVIHSMAKADGVDVDGADQRAGDETSQSIDRAVGPTGQDG